MIALRLFVPSAVRIDTDVTYSNYTLSRNYQLGKDCLICPASESLTSKLSLLQSGSLQKRMVAYSYVIEG